MPEETFSHGTAHTKVFCNGRASCQNSDNETSIDIQLSLADYEGAISFDVMTICCLPIR